MAMPKGFKHSEATRLKMSLSQTGNTNALGNTPWNKGKHHSEATRKKMGLSKMGNTNSLGKKGFKHTEATKEKIRLSNTGKIFPEETRKKMGEARKGKYTGKNSPLWRGGTSPEGGIIRFSEEYINWRTAIYEKDNYTCQDCGAKNGDSKSINLNAHHIKGFTEFPELRFEVSNGRTLCEDCHLRKGLHKKDYISTICNTKNKREECYV